MLSLGGVTLSTEMLLFSIIANHSFPLQSLTEAVFKIFGKLISVQSLLQSKTNRLSVTFTFFHDVDFFLFRSFLRSKNR